MSNVTPLVRVTGTAHGTRTQKIEAKPEVRDPDTGELKYEAREASSYEEVGVAVRGRFGQHVTATNTGTLAVVVGEDDPRPGPGDEIDWLCAPYVRWVPGQRGRRPFPSVALRFAAVADDPSAAGDASGTVPAQTSRSASSLAAVG